MRGALRGRVWTFGDNIDTDVLVPRDAFFLPPDEAVKHMFAALRPDWWRSIRPGDIVVAGRNFGQGSGRPAAKLMRHLGVSCLLADSLNGLYRRNSVNEGFWSLACPGVRAAFEEGDEAEVDLDAWQVRNTRTGATLAAGALPDLLVRTIAAGGLFAMLEADGYIAPEPVVSKPGAR